MKHFSILFMVALPLSFSFASTEPVSADSANCTATREFVTALEFLRADEHFRLKDDEGKELAFKIASGCTGAAKRFIRVAKALTTAGANRKNATDVALKFTGGSDAETDAFTTVFRNSIAEDSLDLDFDSSVKVALSLSKEFKGDLKKVREDFEKIVDYCSDAKNLGLPRNECASFAAAVAKTGERWKEGVATPFIDAFTYLKSEKGPALVSGDALNVAQKLIAQGPGAPENFMQAFQYATSSSGLALTRQDAIQFAQKMAAITKDEVKTETLKPNPAKKNSN